MTHVLIHGGSFDARCWDELVALLPPSSVAVDLPGRGSRPAPLADLSLSDFVDAIVDEIQTRDLRDVVLVGHSMAGISMPGVLERVHDRVRHLVFVACTVPADGERIVDTLDPEIRAIAQENAKSSVGSKLDDATAAVMFCNDMEPDQVRSTLDRMVPEAVQVTIEPVSLEGLRHRVPRTWVRTDHDVVVAPAKQDQFAERVGATVVPFDAAHMAMISQPRALADVLLQLS